MYTSSAKRILTFDFISDRLFWSMYLSKFGGSDVFWTNWFELDNWDLFCNKSIHIFLSLDSFIGLIKCVLKYLDLDTNLADLSGYAIKGINLIKKLLNIF